MPGSTAYKLAWAKENRPRRAEHVRRYRAKLRQEFLREYGEACTRCNSTEKPEVHHINHDGLQHRESVGGTGTRVLEDLKRRGWPKDGITVLCTDCNDNHPKLWRTRKVTCH